MKRSKYVLWRQGSNPKILRLKRRKSSLRHPDDYEVNGTQSGILHYPIPPFINETEGRNDKIHLVWNMPLVICDSKEDVKSFILHLGGYPVAQRGARDLFSKLFNVAPFNGDAKELKIRSNPLQSGRRILTPPLFSGRLRFHRVRLPQQPGKIAVCITAHLSLNVNRALNHRRRELATCQPGAIFASARGFQKGLCGGDNLAPLSLSPSEHDAARGEYIKQVIAVLTADLRRAARVAELAGSEGVFVAPSSGSFSLRQVETCWDVGGVGYDAPQALEDLSPILREYGGTAGWEGNGGAITLHANTAEKLVVYAKAPQRLRLEIRHHTARCKTPYTAETVDALIEKLDEFRQRAASKMNPILRALESRQTRHRTGEGLESFVLAWGACCGISDASKAILGILRREGRVFGGHFLNCITGGQKLLRKARDKGLVRHELGAYRPVIPNASPTTLTGFDNPPSFSAHNTETQPVESTPEISYTRRIVRGEMRIPPPPPTPQPGIPGLGCWRFVTG